MDEDLVLIEDQGFERFLGIQREAQPWPCCGDSKIRRDSGCFIPNSYFVGYILRPSPL